MLTIKNLLYMLFNGFSGALATTISSILLYPIDNIKTRMQVVENIGIAPLDNEDDKKIRMAKSYKELITKIYNKEGIKGFYRGLLTICFANIFMMYVYFFWYEYFQIIFQNKSKSLVQNGINSFLAGTATVVFTNPFFVINSNTILKKGQTSFLKVIVFLYKEDGWKAFYKGFGSSLILVLNPLIQFTIYEQFKIYWQNSQSTGLIHFIGGIISKATASFVTYPYQLIRTNQHIHKGNKSSWEILKEIKHEKGIRGLFKGHMAKFFQTILNSGIMLLIYEHISHFSKSLIETFLK